MPSPLSKESAAEIERLASELHAAVLARDFDRALQLAALLEEQTPDSGLGPFWRGFVRLQLGQQDGARLSFRKAVDLERHRPDFQFYLALSEMNLGQYDAAMKRFREALRLDPRLEGAHLNIGSIHARRGERAAALRAFHRALVINPKSVPALTSIAEIALAEGDLATALAHADGAMRTAPAGVPALLVRAQVYEIQGRAEAALADYHRILQADPGHAMVLSRLAMLCARLGRADEARSLAARALQANPSDGHAEMARAIAHGETPSSLPREVVTRLFDYFSASYDRHMTENLRFAAPRMVHAALQPWFAQRGGSGDALDLGCGTGLLGALLRPNVGALHGVDLSAGMLARAAERKIYDSLENGDLFDYLKARDARSADLVVAADVFIYVGALEHLVAEVARVLRPAGAAAFTIELATPGVGQFALLPTGRYQHTRDYIATIAAQAGLAVVHEAQEMLRMEAGQAQQGMVMVLQAD